MFNSFSDQATFGYGTGLETNNISENNSASPRRVIFCVHGKLSGCCTVVSGGIDEENKTTGEYPRIQCEFIKL